MSQAALTSTETERFNGLTIGKVSFVYPEANMVDIVMYDGSILKQVQVMTPFASSRTGSVNLPVSKYNEEMLNRNKRLPLNNAKINESDVFAVLGFIGGSVIAPFVLGFLFPENCEILCGRDQKGNEDGTQFLWKHESNVYVRVAKGYNEEGSTGQITPDIEISHPSGLFIKIGRNTTLEPITNWDKEIRPFKKVNPETNSADPAPYIYISHPSGDYLIIDPAGNLTEYLVGNVTRTILGDVIENISGNYTRTITKDLSDTIGGDAIKDVTGTLTDNGATIQHN
jgi:hypothetical protein